MFVRKLFVALTILFAAPTLAATNFTVVNATGLDIVTLEIRRFGTSDWKPLSAKPPSGGRGQVEFSDPDCAFDVRARLSGNVEVVWPGVNLCEVTAITLNRSASGTLWVDYD